jgi:hypothetical protein
MQALLWNMRTFRMLLRERGEWLTPRARIPMHPDRGGVTRSSDDQSVMDWERRGHSVSEMKSINLHKEGRNR